MKKLFYPMMAALFLAAVSAPAFAAEAQKEATPTAKTMKHKAVSKHKKSHHRKKKAAKPESTPAAKK
ncbi:MAG TPA: hypothetical protein VJ873_03920 [bacterium]|nr:hypothetical protein [bacterium]